MRICQGLRVKRRICIPCQWGLKGFSVEKTELVQGLIIRDRKRHCTNSEDVLTTPACALFGSVIVASDVDERSSSKKFWLFRTVLARHNLLCIALYHVGMHRPQKSL